MSTAQNIEPMNSTPARVMSGIETNGFYVHHGALESGIPVTCSIGMHQSFDQPEIVLMGVEEQLARSIISSVASRLHEGLVPHDFSRRVERDITANGDVVLMKLGVSHSSALAAFLGHLNVNYIDDLILVQVPDARGLFPSHEDCAADFAKMQSPDNLKFKLKAV